MPETTVTQYTSNLPPYSEPFYLDLLARAGYESALPYEAYGGQRQAYFSPMEQQAMSGIAALGVSGTPQSLVSAGQTAYDLSQDPGIGTDITSGYTAGALSGAEYDPSTRQSGYQASQYDGAYGYNPYQRSVGYDPGTLDDPEMLERYMSPYYQNVLDVEKREMSRQADIRNTLTGLDAAGQGSLGGYREGIIRSETERNLMQAMGDVQTRGSQAAFTSAQQAFEADRSAQGQLEQFKQSQFSTNEQFKQRATELMQQGFSLNEAVKQAQEELMQGQYGLSQQALQAGAQIGIDRYSAQEQARQQAGIMGLEAQRYSQLGQIEANRAQLEAAGMLGDYSLQQQNMEFDRINALSQAGLAERNMMQGSLDLGYEDYLRQQGYGWEQLGRYSNILQGVPYAPSGTSTTYGQDPSIWSQVGGTGIAGAGIYNALRGP